MDVMSIDQPGSQKHMIQKTQSIDTHEKVIYENDGMIKI